MMNGQSFINTLAFHELLRANVAPRVAWYICFVD